MERQNQIDQLVRLIQGRFSNKKKEKDHGGAPAPKTAVRVGPDRRAQAVLRAANRPKTKQRYMGADRTVIRNPAVGISADKVTQKNPRDTTTSSTLGFNRIQPGNPHFNGTYATKTDNRRFDGAKAQTAHQLHKDRLRSAAVKHAMGRQMTDVRPGHEVDASTISSRNGRNPRGRIYEKLTNGVLKFDKGKRSLAVATKMTKDTWKPHNLSASGPDHPIVKFNPNDLKNPLKALAQMTVVRATSRLIGGPIAQPAMAVDDGIAAATGKRPSKEIAKEHLKTQGKLVGDLQKRKKIQAPWVGSGPF